MTEKHVPVAVRLLPLFVLLIGLAIWFCLSRLGVFPESAFPSPVAVARGFGIELRSGRLLDDLIASLFRVSCGFLLAVILGLPTGLWMGHHFRSRVALLRRSTFFAVSPHSPGYLLQFSGLALAICRPSF
jgi:NitT/TauT family transport system permease protein